MEIEDGLRARLLSEINRKDSVIVSSAPSPPQPRSQRQGSFLRIALYFASFLSVLAPQTLLLYCPAVTELWVRDTSLPVSDIPVDEQQVLGRAARYEGDTVSSL